MNEQIRYLKCTNCGYEDSSILIMTCKSGEYITMSKL